MSSNDVIYKSKAALVAFLEAQGFSTSGGISWDGSTADGVATYKSSSEATVEANLTFDGTTLTVTGDVSIAGDTTLGDASGDTATINSQTIVLANVATGTDNTVLVYNGSSIVTDEIDSRVWGSTLVDGTNGTDNELAIFTDSNSVEGDSNLTWDGSTLDVGGALTVDGNTTLGDASGDSVTINAQTIDLANVAAGTDNTVLIYNGSTVLTDEIDSKVWDEKLIDYTGTPANNELAVWTDTDTVEGDSNLTWNGSTLDVGGALTVDGYVTLVNGFSSSLGTPITGVDRSGAGEAVKVAEFTSTGYNNFATAVIDVLLAGHDGTAEIFQARVHLRAVGSSTTNSICQVDIIQDTGTEAWETTDFVLTQKTSSPYQGQLWVYGATTNQQCYATITNGSSTGDSNYKTDWYLTPEQTWGSYATLGTDITTINVKKRFDSLVIDGDLTVTGNDIKGSGGTAITMDGSNNVTVAGDLNVTDDLRVFGSIQGSGYVDIITFSGVRSTTLTGDLTVSTAGSSIAQETWTAASFATNWEDYSVSYQPVSYFKDSFGIVHVKGLAKCTTGTTPGTTIFTLPVGYRPAKIEIFTSWSTDGAFRLDVNTAGNVVVSTGFSPGSSKWASTAGVSFDTR